MWGDEIIVSLVVKMFEDPQVLFIGVKTSEDVLVPNPEYSAGSALTECLVSRM